MSALRVPVGGAAAWLAAAVVGVAGLGELTLVDAMLLLGVVVVVPVAVPLHPAGGARAAIAAVIAGLPVIPALLMARGTVAAVLATPWLVAAVVGALVAVGQWWRQGRRVRELVWVAAPAYLVVGAVWLLADRVDLEPVGVAAPFVQLTAVHFHYAGFASALLVGCALRWLPTSRLAPTSALLTVAAPPIVAIGFTFAGVLQIVGAALLTGGLWLLAWLTVRHVAPQVARLPKALLIVSSAAVLMPMILAVQWAVGANLGTPALSIADMARTHGVVNAVGFTLLGAVGWRLADRAAAG